MFENFEVDEEVLKYIPDSIELFEMSDEEVNEMFENFEKFAETISNTGKNGIDFGKLSYKAVAEQKALHDLYTQIGKAFVDQNKDIVIDGELGELKAQAVAKAQEIETLKAQIRMIRGVVVCENCGAEVDAENDYCGKCGTKLVKPEPPAEETDEITDDEESIEVEVVVEDDHTNEGAAD